MSRPLSQGDTFKDRDVQSLMKIAARVSLDRKLREADRQEIKKYLKKAITLLLNAERDALSPKPAKKSA